MSQRVALEKRLWVAEDGERLISKLTCSSMALTHADDVSRPFLIE